MSRGWLQDLAVLLFTLTSQKTGFYIPRMQKALGSGKADFGYADSIKPALQWVLTEWKTDNPGAATFSGTGRELFRVNMVTEIHGVQEITFNPLSKPGNEDYGLLYIGVGDGGCAESGYPFLAHSKEKIWGRFFALTPRAETAPMANMEFRRIIHLPTTKIPTHLEKSMPMVLETRIVLPGLNQVKCWPAISGKVILNR